jgi:excisionase family DNA binding protein
MLFRGTANMNTHINRSELNYPETPFRKDYGLSLEKEFYTPKELAELLQLKVHTIYKYVRDGKLPVYVFGKNQRFRCDDVEKFLNLHKRTIESTPSKDKLTKQRDKKK